MIGLGSIRVFAEEICVEKRRSLDGYLLSYSGKTEILMRSTAPVTYPV